MYKFLSTNVDDDNFFSLSLENEKEFIKTASKRDLPKEVDEAIKNLARRKDHAYILTTAMGDGETWGSNKNADYFPNEALLGMQGTPVMGYIPEKDERLSLDMPHKKRFETFEDGHFFHHHKNKIEKDPAFGYVPKAIWNPKMRTVLLIVGVDRNKDPETAERIDRNELIPVSMGAKVPFDVCMVCGNKAKNILQYCDCIKFKRNQILSNGKRAALLNLFTRFFDISKVNRPAFIAGLQLEKVASSVDFDLAIDLADQYNLAQYDKLAEDKIADIKKNIPLHVDGAIHRVAKTEKDLPLSLMNDLSKLEPQEAWGALTHAGIIAKPNEFAYILLKHNGDDKQAENFIGAKVYLKDGKPEDLDTNLLRLGMIHINETARKVSYDIPNHVIEDRGVQEKLLSKRIYDTDKGHRKEASIIRTIGLGSILSALYLFYRANVNESINPEGLLASGIVNMIEHTKEPDHYISNNYNIEQMLNKKAGIQGNIIKGFAGFSVPYIVSAHQEQKAQAGQPVGAIGNFVAKHPVSLGILGASAALAPKATGEGIKNLAIGAYKGLKRVTSK